MLIIKGNEHPEERVPLWKPKKEEAMTEKELKNKPRHKVGDDIICPYCGAHFKFDGDAVVQPCSHCWKPINLK